MRFPTRRTPRAEGCVATYAAVVGDRVLWVVTPEPTPLVLAPTSGGPVLEPDEVDDGQPGHHGARFDLDRLPVEAGSHVVRCADGRRVSGPSVRPVSAGAQLALTRDDAHALHVVRRPVPRGPTLRAARLDGDRVVIHLDEADDGAGHTALQLVDAGAVVLTVPVGADGGLTIAADDLTGLDPGERSLRLLVAGHPVRRRANDLADPGAGVPLPALHPEGAARPRARLRWSPEATLVLRLVEQAAEPAG